MIALDNGGMYGCACVIECRAIWVIAGAMFGAKARSAVLATLDELRCWWPFSLGIVFGV